MRSFNIHSCLIITLLIIVSSYQSVTYAGHYYGSSSQIDYLGGDSIKVGWEFYRDCLSQNFQDTIVIEVSSACGTQNFTLDRQLIEDITSLCENQCSACDSQSCNSPLGIERHYYEGLIDLSTYSSCCEFTLNYVGCCRDHDIDNIENPNLGGLSHESTVDLCQSDEFSTPEWQNDPLTVLCTDIPFISDQGVIDPYGDSVTYELVDPLNSAGNPVSWEQDYSTQAPLSYQGIQFGLPNASFPAGFHLNKQTGELKYTPTTNDFVGVFVIKANQYKDGNIISETRREAVVAHVDCSQASGPDLDPEPDRHQQICADSTLIIDIDVTDPANNHMVMAGWNENPKLDGAVYINDTGFASASAQFIWTPDTAHAREKPYLLGYKARVDACPVYSSVSGSMQITVNPPPELSYSAEVQSCGVVDFEAELTNIDGGDFYWDIEGGIDRQSSSFTYNFDPGTHAYQLTVSGVGCTFTYHDTFIVSEYLSVDAGPDGLVCENEPFTVSPQPQHYEGSLEEVTYDVNGHSFTDSVDVISAIDTQLVITAEDSAGCKARDTVFLEVRALPDPDVSDIYFCPEEDFITLSTSLHPQYDIQWRSAAGQLLDAGPNFSLPDTGRYVLRAIDHDLPECGETDTFAVYQAEAISGVLPDVQKCQGETLQIGAILSGMTYTWYHSGRGTLIGTDSLLEHTVDTSGDISLMIEKPFGPRNCTYHDTFTLEVTPSPEADLAGPDDHCINGGPVVLPEHDTHETTWSGPGVEEGMWHPAEAGVGVHALNYTLTDGSTGCSIIDSVEAAVHALPALDFTVDPDSGDAPLTVTLSGSVAENGAVPVWDVRDADGVSDTVYGEVWDTEHVFDSAGSYNIVFSAADSVTGCRDTTSKSVTVTEEPNLLIMEDDPAIAVYPNPAGDVVHIESLGASIDRVLLSSVNGSIILDSEPSSEIYELQRGEIKAGVYILHAELADGRTYTGRIVFE